MSELARWLEARTAAGPARLRARVRELAAEPPSRPAAEPPSRPIADALAESSARALAAVTAHPGDRSVALDLLAADALITLALLEQAERDPARLGAFAAGLVQRYGSQA